MNALELKRNTILNGSIQSTLLVGPPGAGKTLYALSVANSPKIDRVFCFSLDKGFESAFFTKNSSGELFIPDESLKKITIYTCEDRKEKARAYDMIKEVLASTDRIWISAEGNVSTRENKDYTPFPGWSKMTPRDVVIIDPLSQLGDSIHNFNKKAFSYKDGRLYYAEDKFTGAGLLQVIQGCRFPTICITHAQLDEQDRIEGAKVYPDFGSRTFGIRCGSYFGNIVYMDVERKKYKKGSSPTFRLNTIARSRTNIKVEDLPKDSDITELLFPNLKEILDAKD